MWMQVQMWMMVTVIPAKATLRLGVKPNCGHTQIQDLLHLFLIGVIHRIQNLRQ
jgi:hypothetical protein